MRVETATFTRLYTQEVSLTMIPRLIASAALAALLLGGKVQAEDPLKSGPQVGDSNSLRGFRPQWVAGVGAGERRCPV